MGVRTRVPVEAVPMTLPPWKSSGGVPIAGSPALLMSGRILLLATRQALLAGTAPTTPAMCPARTGVLVFETQAPGCDEADVAASADPPAAAKIAAPAAARVKVRRRLRLANWLFIRVPSLGLISGHPAEIFG